jgi:Glu-tRNA(Gln) amidotransferase subunit E-like FAD-binding protein
MSELNYKELGFKSGIEIHQQLEGKKLFCNCPTTIRKEGHDFEIKRKLRASAGESGKVDDAALHEQKKQKSFIYRGYDDITCDIELDEEPPMPINREALNAALQIASMLNCKIFDRIEVMRKTVIDGSNTSGFQRTMLIGVDGFVEIEGKKYGIESVCLEEEACQVIERKKDQDIYNLSRLGIPLIEIATAPDMKNPDEVKEVAGKIGMILRSVPICKRGIGSIRQDVNLSIKGGERVEIKGFQDLKSIPKVVDNEIKRHIQLLKKGKMQKEVRKAEPDFSTTYLRPMPGASRMYPETDIPSIKVDLSNIKQVKTIEEKIKEIESNFKINNKYAQEIIKQNIDFDKLVKKFKNLKPEFIAQSIIDNPKEIKKRFGKEFDALENLEVLEKVNSSDITLDAVKEIQIILAEGKEVDYSKFKGVDDKEVENFIKELIKKEQGAPIGALMGKVMAKYRGQVDGKKAMTLLKKNME